MGVKDFLCVLLTEPRHRAFSFLDTAFNIPPGKPDVSCHVDLIHWCLYILHFLSRLEKGDHMCGREQNIVETSSLLPYRY